eukprot:4508349-Prymnesium_polylepis.2
MAAIGGIESSLGVRTQRAWLGPKRAGVLSSRRRPHALVVAQFTPALERVRCLGLCMRQRCAGRTLLAPCDLVGHLGLAAAVVVDGGAAGVLRPLPRAH